MSNCPPQRTASWQTAAITGVFHPLWDHDARLPSIPRGSHSGVLPAVDRVAVGACCRSQAFKTRCRQYMPRRQSADQIDNGGADLQADQIVEIVVSAYHSVPNKTSTGLADQQCCRGGSATFISKRPRGALAARVTSRSFDCHPRRCLRVAVRRAQASEGYQVAGAIREGVHRQGNASARRGFWWIPLPPEAGPHTWVRYSRPHG